MNRLKRCLSLAAVLMALALPLAATTMLRMDMTDLSQRADKIFRGTVIDIKLGTVTAGGGELPTTTYVLRVDEVYKGDLVAKDGVAGIEVTMLGTLKPGTDQGSIRGFSKLPDMPQFNIGGDYLLFTTAPSAIGLSTTVGLGQGAFTVFTDAGKRLMAVNGYNNTGLFDGPVAYEDLTAAVQAEVGQ